MFGAENDMEMQAEMGRGRFVYFPPPLPGRNIILGGLPGMLSPANLQQPSGLDHEEQSERLLEISRRATPPGRCPKKIRPGRGGGGWLDSLCPCQRAKVLQKQGRATRVSELFANGPADRPCQRLDLTRP